MEFFVDVNTYQATNTSPLRENWWETFMELKFKVEDSRGERISMNNAIMNRSGDLAMLIALLEKTTNLQDASQIIYEDGWGTPCFESELYKRIKMRGEQLCVGTTEGCTVLKENPPIQECTVVYSSLSDVVIIDLKEALADKNPEKLDEIVQEYESELMLHSEDFSHFLMIRKHSWVSAKTKSKIDYLLKSSNRWLDSDVILHEN
ncbi:MAG TPA: hypothetical protein VLR89_04450, partial [Anaerolineaceae bacterium]|nr:hypothetical protein [Anaerolineaceae bacterium]